MIKLMRTMPLLLLLAAVGCNGAIGQTENVSSGQAFNAESSVEPPIIYESSSHDDYASAVVNADERFGELVKVEGANYQIEFRKYYVKDDYKDNEVSIVYPKIISQDDIYLTDEKINKYLKDAAFGEFTVHDEKIGGLGLLVECEIKYSSENLLSVEFTGSSYIDGASYVLFFARTLNIDLRYPVDRLRLRDFFVFDDDFVDIFKSNAIFDREKHPIAEEAFNYLVLDDVRGEYSDERIMRELFLADGEIWSAQSYFGKDRLGLSLHVGHNFGGYLLLELEYDDLLDHIRTDNDIWRELLPSLD